ncbi:antibiotic biosynthesis monooxygenase [Actinoplanes sp. N902-109]|uniref:antibiotic biosynthesis monooxygenase family protein n=1 Tax=Actinoplanes sp. (strain N902-109) TaxID=649831 RepID=UPI000329473F|nr:antibiotic biosynthesis monooxygenase family protein [Actinoplanes sp. N902-109]AGL16613.1 antibiotic biosynthesis monooxygenase [Actinoplanes sp. N902-109]
MTGEVRVLVYHATEDADGVLAAYHRVSAEMAQVPGQLGNELLRSVHDDSGFVVLSRWRDLAAFTRWEAGPEHKETTALLRRYRDRRMTTPFGVYQVSAAY